MSQPQINHEIKIAWLLTSGFYYWHPMLSALSKIFPKTKVFTATWNGFAAGFENSFVVDFVGERKEIFLSKGKSLYGNKFTYLSPNILPKLLAFRPNVIFSNSFGIWTIIALLFKPIGKWQVAIAYEGSSPGVDYRNSVTRLFLRRQMVKLADACISNSQAGKAYLIEVLQASPIQVFAHPYEVPSLTTLTQAKPIPELEQLPHPIFLFIGSTIARKGLILLLEACTYLQQQGKDNYTLLIVGDGEQKSELEAFCDQNKLTKCVRWIGRVNYDELGAYLTCADVFILPTLEDTWGVVISEAMIVGKAILCSKFAGAVEMIQDGENGYSFNPNNVQELSEKMIKFIDNQELAAIMGKKSQEIMKQYTPEAAANLMSQVVESILKF
ncbi:glycosyltransferase family 4 protein [Merismopedia glauca]|uniref:Glycosyl transferase n=1 Tax=Merismopedia glauca CCAP 1448/3 TaxID=1296344 RepID=A0A2T1C5K8_9CYAN|nr:glycosyltransferase family 4 protein [Merismopedia glauca]PSB03514.1 glycosyl transferase [Merismopedia glauca CCAP 1448/3]